MEWARYATTLDDSTTGSNKIAIQPYKAGTNTFATSGDWTTPAVADFKVSKKVKGSAWGSEANIGTAPTWVNGNLVLVLSNTELTVEKVKIRVENAAINSEVLYVWTFGHASAAFPGDYADVAAMGMTNLDATISSRASASSLSGLSSDIASDVIAPIANYLDAAVSGIVPAIVADLDSRTIATIGSIDGVLNAIAALNNLSALANLYGSPLLEIPDSSATLFAYTLVVRDNEGKLVNLDALPTITAANAAGTDRSANLSTPVGHPATGRYTFTYSVSSAAAEESLRITCSGTVSAEGRYVEWIGAVVNYDTLTTLAAVKAKTDNLPSDPASATNVTAVYNRIGAPAGASVSADVAALKTDTAAIKAKTNSLTFTTPNVVDASATVAGTYLATGTVVSTTGTTTTLDAGAVATTSYYVGDVLVITAGTGAGQDVVITAYSSGRVATHAAWTVNPDNTSTYQVRTGKSSATATGSSLSPTETATLSRIDSNAAMISAGGFYVTSRVTNSNLIIWQGETWNHAEGTHETITKGAGETWPTDLTGYTITSTITKTSANTNTGSLSTLAMTCTVTQATGANQSFYIETGTTTANLAIGEGTRGYDWHVKAVKGTNEATLRAGTGSVRKRL